MKTFLDVARTVLTVAATAYITLRIWQWHWLAAVVAGHPVYVVMVNLFGFLTLPLYALTPEIRRAREQEKELFDQFKK